MPYMASDPRIIRISATFHPYPYISVKLHNPWVVIRMTIIRVMP
jgi:hypothetical protein